MKPMTLPLTHQDVPLVCEFEFDPGEPAIYWPTEHAHPGCRPYAVLTRCTAGGVDILPLLSQETAANIEKELADLAAS